MNSEGSRFDPNRVRVFVLMQRYLVATQPWMNNSLAGIGNSVVGIAARSVVQGELKPEVAAPFFRLRSRNVFHRLLPKSLRPFSPWSRNEILRRAIIQTKPNRILCHFGTVAVEHLAVFEHLPLPIFVHFHGFDFTFDLLEADGSGKRVHESEYRNQIVKLSQRAIYIANSEFAKSELVRAGVCPDRIRVKHVGVQPEACPKEHSEHEEPIVLHVGRLIDCKGVVETIEAFGKVREKGIAAKLLIVGDGPERERVRNAVKSSRFAESIFVKGTLPPVEVKRLLHEASVFTTHNLAGRITNQTEALNVAILEAMAAGLPVVGTRSGGVQETVLHEETGLLGTPGDTSEQAENLTLLLRNAALRNKMGRAGWQRVCCKFSLQHEVNLLRSILNENGSE